MVSQTDLSLAELRYSKRKRAAVIYYKEMDSDDELLIDVEKEDFRDEPQKKKKKKKKKKVKKADQRLSKRQIFPFMSLPAELLNQIYELALTDNSRVFLISKTKSYRRVATRCIKTECQPHLERRLYWRSGRRYYHQNDSHEERLAERRSFVPNLLAVSKVIEMEAAAFLYRQPITVADNYTLLAFLTQIGPKHTSLLQDITVREWSEGSRKSNNFSAFAVLAPATELRRLNVTPGLRRYGYLAARQVFRDCYPFLEAYGRAKGKRDASVELIEIEDGESFRKELSRLLKM